MNELVCIARGVYIGPQNSPFLRGIRIRRFIYIMDLPFVINVKSTFFTAKNNSPKGRHVVDIWKIQRYVNV